MSRRKQQRFRRDQPSTPRPPWGWLLVAALLLVALGVLLSGRWPGGGESGNREQVSAPTPPGQHPAGPQKATPTPPTPLATAPPATRPSSPSRLPPPASTLQSTLLAPGRLSAFAVTPGGERFLVAAASGIYLFDRATLTVRHYYPTATQALAVALVADPAQPTETTVTALTAAGHVYRWPLAATGDGEATPQAFANFSGEITAAAFSADATLAAVLVGSERSGMEIRIYETGSGRLHHILPAHGGRAEQLLFLAGAGRPRLLTRGGDGRVRLWDSAGWVELELPPALTGGIAILATMPDPPAGPPLLAAGHADGRVSVWDAARWQEVQALPAPEADSVGAATALALSGDRTTFAVSGPDGALSLYDIETGERRGRCATLALQNLFFLPRAEPDDAESPTLLSLGDDGRLYGWDPEAIACGAGEETFLAASDPDRPFLARVDYLAPGPGGMLATAGRAGPLVLWDLAAAAVTAVVDPGGPVGALAFGPEGLVATGGEAGARLWEASTGALIHDPGGHVRTRPGAANVIALAFSPAPTGETAGVLASADRSGLLKLWRTRDGALLRNILPDEPAPVTSLAFSADGYFLLAGGGAGVTIWQPRRSERLGTVAPAGRALALPAPAEAVEANWQMIAVLRGSRVELYQEDGRYLRTLEAVPANEQTAPAAVTAAAFLQPPEGEGPAPLLLASGHDDGTLRLWNAADGRLLATLPRHPGSVTAVEAAGACTLISAAVTGTLRIDQICAQSRKE